MINIQINQNTSILNALKKMNNAGTKCLVVVGALLKFDDPVINEMLSKFHAQ